MTSPQPQARDEVERLVEMLTTGAWSGGAPTPLELEAASTLQAQAADIESLRTFGAQDAARSLKRALEAEQALTAQARELEVMRGRAQKVARHLIALEDNMLRNDADMMLDRDGSPSPRELAAKLLGRPLTDEEEGFPARAALNSGGAE